MKGIMTVVILMLAALVFGSYGVLAKDHLEPGNTIHIKIKNKEMLKFEVEYDSNGNPIKIVDKDGAEWEETDRPPITKEIISIFTVNPCTVCIGSTCWQKNC